MTWVAALLPWAVWALLAIWSPPLLYAAAIDLGLIAAPGSGFPTLRDPALILGTLQIACMAAALRGLAARRRRSWNWLAVSIGVWALHAAWQIFSRARLDGARALRAPETLWPIGGILAALLVLLGIRRYFGREVPRHAHGEGRPQVAPSGPAHVP